MCDKDDKCNIGNLSEYDIKINQLKYNDMFYGTFFVCVVYAIVAIAILLGSYFNETIRDIFFNQFIIFTVIFILGSVIIISILIYYISNYQPKKTKFINNYDTFSCPDYWNMVILDDSYINKNFDSNLSTNYFKYKCVLNPNIYNKLNIYKNIDVINSNLNYGLTNNLLSASNLNSTINGDYYNIYNDNIYGTNIGSNLGHLYKNINNSDIFPIISSNNNFAYNRPGILMTDKNLSNIKSTIIDTSLKMNNYKFDTVTKTYSNINTNSYNNNKDPYITWNFSNLHPTDIMNKHISSNLPSATYENYFIYDWNNNNNLSKDIYNSYFNITGVDSLPVYSFKGNTSSSVNNIKIGNISRDTNSNLYFESIINTNSANFITENADANSIANNKRNFIKNSYIYVPPKPYSDPGAILPTVNITTNSDYKLGPQIIAENDSGRPSSISSNDISIARNIPVVCDTIYPAYLASVEDINTFGTGNAIRCSYAKLCGYSWSDMGCN